MALTRNDLAYGLLLSRIGRLTVSAMSCILIATRDASTAGLAQRALESRGHEAIRAASREAAIRSLFEFRVDAVVLDNALGEEAVKEFYGWLRIADLSHPVVLLASAGARWLASSLPLNPERDEIVTKPCQADDIRRAVERILGAAGRGQPEVLTAGEVTLDADSHELHGDCATVRLTPTEFHLFRYLAQRRGRLIAAEELLDSVWGFPQGTGSSDLVRSHVRNLRKKLRVATGGSEVVETRPRRGYRLI
jgi:DNA-binding response OmpR family regulator